MMKSKVQLLIIIVVAFIPRWLDLGAFLTLDEFLWLERSRNFLLALQAHDWGETFQTGHPGVITMWSGALGLWCYGLTHGLLQEGTFTSFLQALAWDNRPLDLLPYLRLPTGIITSVGIGGIYCLLSRLFSQRVAFVAGLLLALDPMYLAHGRILYHDGLVSTFMTLSALALLLYIRRSNRWALLLSGVCAGLALLSKSLGLFLLPWAGLLFLVALFVRRWPLSQVMTDGALWALLASLTFFVLWPAMWLSPTNTLWRMRQMATTYAINPHAQGQFFLGQPVADPGWLFYPVVALFAMTPLVVLGLLITIGFLGFRVAREGNRVVREGNRVVREGNRKGLPLQKGFGVLREGNRKGFGVAREGNRVVREGNRKGLPLQKGFGVVREGNRKGLPLQIAPTMRLLLVYVVAYLLFVSLGEKKRANYLLPALVMLNVVAAVGINVVVGQIASTISKRGVSKANGMVLVTLLLLIAQAITTLPHHPYYLTYYNPLLGGNQVAVRNLLVGWGEGNELAAEYLNQLPDTERLRVIASKPSTFAPYFEGETLFWRPVAKVFEADYVVLYRRDVQKQQPDAQLLRYIRQSWPLEKTITLHGLPYAWIYRAPAADWTLSIKDERDVVGESGLLGYRLGPPVDGRLQVTLYRWHDPLIPKQWTVQVEGNRGQWEAMPAMPINSPSLPETGAIIEEVYEVEVNETIRTSKDQIKIGFHQGATVEWLSLAVPP